MFKTRWFLSYDDWQMGQENVKARGTFCHLFAIWELIVFMRTVFWVNWYYGKGILKFGMMKCE